MENIEDIITQVIKNENTINSSVTDGSIIAINSNCINVVGLKQPFLREKIIFDNRYYGIITSFSEAYVNILPLFHVSNIKINSSVKQTQKTFTINVGSNINGRLLNGIGQVIDDKAPLNGEEIDVFPSHVDFMENELLEHQILTGISAIDWMLPIGFGQKMAILGNIGSQRTTMVQTVMENISYNDDLLNIYVSMGQTTATTLWIYERLQTLGVKNFVIILASNNDPVSHIYMAPFIANSLAYYYSTKGINCVIFHDSLSQHAIAHREIALTTGLTPGKESYPGNTFSLYGDLLEYACKLPEHRGGGSISYFPIVDLVEDDISSFLATTIISITDGQIILKDGKIDITQSVSRVGNSIQNKFLKQYTKTLKLKLARYEEYLQLSRLSTNLSKENKLIIQEGTLISHLINQDFFTNISLEEQILYLCSIDRGLLKNKDILFVNKLKETIPKLNMSNIDSQENIDMYYEKLVTTLQQENHAKE